MRNVFKLSQQLPNVFKFSRQSPIAWSITSVACLIWAAALFAGGSPVGLLLLAVGLCAGFAAYDLWYNRGTQESSE